MKKAFENDLVEGSVLSKLLKQGFWFHVWLRIPVLELILFGLVPVNGFWMVIFILT